jgi:Rrf2 family protein
MFKINRRTDYAIRVGVALAKRPFGFRLSTQAIQSEMQIPRPFLQRIVAELSKAHLIKTYSGPSGGLQLARPAEQISMLDIVQLMEGPLCISDCIYTPGSCPLSDSCPVRSRWGRLQTVMMDELAQTSLQQLAQETLEISQLTHPNKVLVFSRSRSKVNA